MVKQEADVRDLPKEGYEGGLLIDEMSIQEDLRFKRSSNDIELVGFDDTGDDSRNRHILMGNSERKLATHVCQLLFIGHTGFR